MFEVVIKGIGAGLLLSILVGPVFFAILQHSIEKGYRKTIPLILGVSLSDIVYIVICFFGIAGFMDNTGFRFWLSIFGGTIMLFFGIYSFFKKTIRRSALDQEEKNKYGTIGKSLLKGFLINGINPSVLLFWLGMVSMASVNHQVEENSISLFFICIIATIFLTDNMKAYLAHKVSSMITTRFLKILNGVTGVGFILFSIKLFHSAYTLQFS